MSHTTCEAVTHWHNHIRSNTAELHLRANTTCSSAGVRVSSVWEMGYRLPVQREAPINIPVYSSLHDKHCSRAAFCIHQQKGSLFFSRPLAGSAIKGPRWLCLHFLYVSVRCSLSVYSSVCQMRSKFRGKMDSHRTSVCSAQSLSHFLHSSAVREPLAETFNGQYVTPGLRLSSWWLDMVGTMRLHHSVFGRPVCYLWLAVWWGVCLCCSCGTRRGLEGEEFPRANERVTL